MAVVVVPVLQSQSLGLDEARPQDSISFKLDINVQDIDGLFRDMEREQRVAPVQPGMSESAIFQWTMTRTCTVPLTPVRDEGVDMGMAFQLDRPVTPRRSDRITAETMWKVKKSAQLDLRERMRKRENRTRQTKRKTRVSHFGLAYTC